MGLGDGADAWHLSKGHKDRKGGVPVFHNYNGVSHSIQYILDE